MLINDNFMGRIEVRDIPLPKEMDDIFGTFTYSGRVLVSCRLKEDPEEKDWYNVFTVNDDGTDLRKVFSGKIPQKKGANGIRWMCFQDNRRILLGDYVMECEPDIDYCENVELVPLVYPEELMQAQGVFCHWSEIVIAPDNIHMSWTVLTLDGATNYLGRLVRKHDCYILEDICIISSEQICKPDPNNDGCVIPLPVRGGEVKQFLRGGKALTMVGNGDSITESVVQYLDSEELIQITNTPGYEETTIFSPDEKLGVVMSPRFSEKTNCAVFGLVPQPHAMAVRGRIINVLYMYCVAGVRDFRRGNIGPVLIDIEKSCAEGRGYSGVNLSDPEDKWVYYSPISWHPDSTRAMWNERTRPVEGKQKCRLRMCHLLDYRPAVSVCACNTPDAAQIPYAQPFDRPGQKLFEAALPMKIMGKSGGYVLNARREGDYPVYETIYEDFSDDGLTFYHGHLTVQAPDDMFAAGKTIFEADLNVSGEHKGEMKLRAVFERQSAGAPAMISFEKGEDNLPESHGYASYDGKMLRVEDMEP